MKKIHLEIHINADREKVWEIMLSPQTYMEWTTAFHPGSHYRGIWKEGEKMLFVGPDEESGGEAGMVSIIRKFQKPECVSIEHIGIYKNGIEDTESLDARKWSPAFENYSFFDKDNGTLLVIDQDINEEYEEMFVGMWNKALLILKGLCER